MFFSNRPQIVAALVVAAAAVFVTCGLTRSRADTTPPPAAMPANPPILGVNDPANPFHLTATQQKAYVAIKIKYQADATAVMESKSIPDTQKQANIRELQIESSKKLRGLLTPTQLAILNELTNKQKQIFALQKKREELVMEFDKTVTPDQKAKLLALRSSIQAKQNTIQSSSASQEVKASETNDLRTDFQNRVKALLNAPNQQSLMKQIDDTEQQIGAAEQQLQSGAH